MAQKVIGPRRQLATLLLIVSSFFALAIDIFYEFAPVYLTAKWMLGPADLILYNSLLCVALAVGNGWLAPFSSTRFLARRGIILSIGGFAFLLLGIVLTNQTLMMMGLFTLCGLAIGLGWTLITVKISDAVPDTIQGEVMGVQMSLRFLGDALICILGGLLLLVSQTDLISSCLYFSRYNGLLCCPQGCNFKIGLVI